MPVALSVMHKRARTLRWEQVRLRALTTDPATSVWLRPAYQRMLLSVDAQLAELEVVRDVLRDVQTPASATSAVSSLRERAFSGVESRRASMSGVRVAIVR